MITSRLVRLEQSDQGALGVLMFDGSIFSYTLEPDMNEPGKLYIPQGMYCCQRFHGTKWPNTFEIIVPGHTAVLFHSGNVEADTRGCVLLGATVGKLRCNRAVLNSGDTFKAFLSFLVKESDFVLFMEDRYS